MVIDALLAAEPVLGISTWVFNPKKFTYLTDEIMSHIEMRAEDDEVCIKKLYTL